MSMTVDQVRDRLRGACEKADSIAAWCRNAGVHRSYVMNVLAGREEAGPAILDALGLERIVIYRVKRERRG